MKNWNLTNFIKKEIVGEITPNGYARNGFLSNSLKRNHSDGSDRDNDFDEDYSDDLESNTGKSSSHDDEHLFDLDDDDLVMPRVFIQNKPIALDKITPKLINLMNESEKDNYINICRELYSVIYEI